MALPPFDFLTSAPIDQLGTSLGKDFDYLGAYRSGQGIRNDIDYSNQPMIQVMPPPFTIGDNSDVINMNRPDYMNFQKYMRERGAADLINPQNQVPIKDVGSDSKGIGEIILPPIAGGGGGGVEGAIDYNNLTLRNQNTDTGIDSNVAAKFKQYENYKFTDQDYANTIAKLREYNPNFNSYTDQDLKQMIDMGAFKNVEPQKTGILQSIKAGGSKLLDFIKKGGVIGNIASELLPEMDPRQKALRDFYGDNFDLTSSGSVASGIMKGYNPVSGGGLYTLTGGRLGEEPTYGLDEAMGERMGNIKNMLSKKHKQNFSSMDDEEFETFIKSIEGQKLFRYGEKYGSPGYTSAAENFLKIKSLKEKEALALKEAQEKVKEKEYQDRIAREADTAARARAANAAVYASADRQGFTNDRGGFSTSAADRAGTSEGSGQFSSKSGRGRTGYGKGGIVTL